MSIYSERQARCTGIVQPYTGYGWGEGHSMILKGKRIDSRQCRNKGKTVCEEHGARCRLHPCECQQ